MRNYDVNIKYDEKKDKVELVFKVDYKEVTSAMFVSKKPAVEDVWSAINNMSTYDRYEFIDKIYKEYQKGKELIDLLLSYSEKCIRTISNETRSLCEDALYYGMEYNGIRLLDDKKEAFKCFLAEKLWHMIIQH